MVVAKPWTNYYLTFGEFKWSKSWNVLSKVASSNLMFGRRFVRHWVLIEIRSGFELWISGTLRRDRMI